MEISELAEVFAAARRWQTAAVPAPEDSSEGHDHTGCVTARVDAAAVLTSVSVSERWTREGRGAPVGDAVREAAASALASLYGFPPPEPGAVTKDWGSVFAELTTAPITATEDDVRRATHQISEAADALQREASRLSLDEANERFLEQFDRLMSLPAPAVQTFAPTVVGSPAQIELTFVGLGLLTSCVVNAHWARSASGATLTMRFNELIDTFRKERQASHG